MWDNNMSFSLFNFTLCRPWQMSFHSTGPEDYDNPSNYLSDKPTRLIAIYNSQAAYHDEYDLFEQLKTLGDINNIVPDISTNLTIVSYFKLEDAQKAIDFIKKRTKTALTVNFAKPCVLKKEHDQSLFISLTITALKKPDYRRHLSTFGRISSLSDATVSFDKKLINIEFDDERVSQSLINELNNVTLNGIEYKIFKCDDDRVSSSCYSAVRKEDFIIKRPSTKSPRTQKSLDIKKNKVFSYFSTDPFSSCSDITSTTSRLPETNTASVHTSPIVGSPKEKSSELDLEKIANGSDCRTTFMIRNIPNKYSQIRNTVFHL